jgi:hypothetical protein
MAKLVNDFITTVEEFDRQYESDDTHLGNSHQDLPHLLAVGREVKDEKGGAIGLCDN